MVDEKQSPKSSSEARTDDDTITETLVEFPCDFPIKVLGEINEHFAQDIASVIQTVQPHFDAGSINMRTSSGGRYISLTCTVHVESKPELDAIYRALSTYPAVKFVL